MTFEADPVTRPDRRTLLGRHLVGDGIEIGPGHRPFPLVFGGSSVRYVDRWTPEANRSLFQELDDFTFVDPDIVANLDTERLSALADASQDFVIASHVLEHLAEPIGQLVDIYRVLRPGGLLLLFLPDRTRTFDRGRRPTDLAHLIEEHRRGVTEVDDAHLAEFVANVPEDWGPQPIPVDDAERFERHRLRSIHVHCWTESEFMEVLAFTVTEFGCRWELVDRIGADDSDDAMEFGLALRRPTVELPTGQARERLLSIWSGTVGL